jgi:hypothetical protein
MRKLWLVLMIATMVTALGCGPSAESAARKIFEGIKEGDSTALLDHLDFRGIYEMEVPEADRDEMPFEKFEMMLREQGEELEVAKGFDYDVLGSDIKDDVTIVTVKVKENEDAEWKNYDVPFKKIDGTWKLTAEGFQRIGQQAAPAAEPTPAEPTPAESTPAEPE